jgi:Base plate wedge protein 53
MTEYFQNFPNILYTFDPNLTEYSVVKNIFARVKIIDAVLQNSLVYYAYNMKESDRAEIISDKYYGSTKRHWVVMFANQVVDPYFDFPLKDRDLNNNIIAKYGSLVNAQATLHHVEQHVNVTSSLAGTSNTISYVSRLQDPYTYNFALGQVQSLTLPNIAFPVIDQGTTSVTMPDGTLVSTDTSLVAISNYNYEVSTNESKRQIQLLDKQYVDLVENQLQSLLSQ